MDNLHLIQSIFEIKYPSEQIKNIEKMGGMTNSNYHVIGDKEYVVRVPGEGTSAFIDRIKERENTLYAVEIGLHPSLIFFDEHTGIKITEYINEGRTLSINDRDSTQIIEDIANALKNIHCDIRRLSKKFCFSEELDKYLSLVKKSNMNSINEILDLIDFVLQKIATYEEHLVICHNDLVPENWVLTQNKLFLLDWEYAGMNDPCWDIASFFSEWDLQNSAREFFLDVYLPHKENMEWWKEKVLVYEMAQHILWYVWSILKIQLGANYESYAQKRLCSARQIMQYGAKLYGWL